MRQPQQQRGAAPLDGVHHPLRLPTSLSRERRGDLDTRTTNAQIGQDGNGDVIISNPALTLPACFSPIVPALARIGEDEPPPSWDPISTPRVMVAKGSPKFNMVSRGSPKLNRLLAIASATKKKNSPKVSNAKKNSSPKGKKRAYWNPTLERSLVDILHEYNNSHYRGDNGWTSEGWNKMVKEFHDRNKYVSFTKNQIQEKERELKREYKMLKEAKNQSGISRNEDRCMIQTFPKIKKFRNNKATFPLFNVLGELYDGKLAEGTYNFTSMESPQETPLRQITTKDKIQDLEQAVSYDDEAEDAHVQIIEDENASVERMVQRRVLSLSREEEAESSDARIGHQRVAAVSRNKEERETKKLSKSGNIEGMMERYLEMRTKQVENEVAQLNREKETAQGTDFSITRCISVLNTMEITKVEKAKAYVVFKNQENREIFLSACSEDPDSAMIWLRAEMA